MESENQNHCIEMSSVEPNAAIKNAGNSFRESGRVAAEEEGTEGAANETDEKCPKTKKNIKKTILVLVQVLVLFLILGFLAASLLFQVLKTRFPAGLQIWKWCLFALSVLCGFALVLWVYWPVMFFVEKAFTLNPEVIYFAYGLRKSFAFFLWWIWVLLMWLILMEHRIQNTSPRATKVLLITTRTIISLAVGSFSWVLLTIALRSLSVKCRFNRYINKVIHAAEHLDILRCLNGDEIGKGKRVLNWFCTSKAGDGILTHDEISRIYTFNSKKFNFFNSDYIFDSAEKNMDFTTMQKMQNISTDEDARKVGIKIFNRVVHARSSDAGCIIAEDLKRFIHDIDPVLALFDATKSRSIDRKYFVEWVVRVYQDRRMLVQALSDNKTATKQLTIMLRTILVITGIIGWLLWIDVLTTQLLAAFLTAIAGSVFIFGETVKTTFQSIMFVFMMHPFDIGDTCIIDNVSLVVEQMNILTTIFLNTNDQMTYYPNSVLSTKVITNTSRSCALGDTLPICTDTKTPIQSSATATQTEPIINNATESSGVAVEGTASEDNMITRVHSIMNCENLLEDNNG